MLHLHNQHPVMKRMMLWFIPLVSFMVSCGSQSAKDGGRVITVSIPPFAYFVEAVAGDDFKVNIMLPPGADHHIWEPLPAQINALAGSEAFIINGQLGFEQAWMGRFREINPEMRILDLSDNIDLIETNEAEVEDDPGSHEGHLHGGPDPHYWMSPVSAYVIAEDVTKFLTELNPSSAQKYEAGLKALQKKIAGVDLLSGKSCQWPLQPLSLSITRPLSTCRVITALNRSHLRMKVKVPRRHG